MFYSRRTEHTVSALEISSLKFWDFPVLLQIITNFCHLAYNSLGMLPCKNCWGWRQTAT